MKMCLDDEESHEICPAFNFQFPTAKKMKGIRTHTHNLNAVKVINLQRTMSHRDNEESIRDNKVKNEWMWGFPFHWDDTVVKYADGSTYSGHLTRDGQANG